MDPLGTYDSVTYSHLLAGFDARLSDGAYGRGKVKQTNTVQTYVAAVEWNRKQHFKEDLHDQVMRGIKKDKGTSHRDKHTVTFSMMCDLTETLTNKQAGLSGLM